MNCTNSSGLQALFITATGTGVGKTLVAGHLLRFLLDCGIRACYQKWVSTGGPYPADLAVVRRMAGLLGRWGEAEFHVPYHFPMAASPHLAAEKAGAVIDEEHLVACFHAALARYDFLIVEGVGGVLVPLRRDLLLVDLVARLGLATLVVARSGLGTINHTLLTIEALRARGVAVLGVVFTDESPHDEPLIVADNMTTVAALSPIPVLGRLPWKADWMEVVSRAPGMAQERPTEAEEASSVFFQKVGAAIINHLKMQLCRRNP